jgi:hypothetical protein
MQASGVYLGRGGIPELQPFQRYLPEYRIVVYSSLQRDIMFEEQVASSMTINLLYDDQHYHIFRNLMAAKAKR